MWIESSNQPLRAFPSSSRPDSRSSGWASRGTGSPARARTPLRRPLFLARAAPRPAPPPSDAARPGRLDRFAGAAGEAVGVLVGHTHFDHAVDAPAIAPPFGCNAYGSSSLVNLMAPARARRRAVEVEPYRTYELGPFEVSFIPSAPLEAAARPRRSLRRRPHLRAPRLPLAECLPLRPGLGHLRSRSPGCASTTRAAPTCRRCDPRARGRRLPRRRRRPQLHPRLLAADPPRLDPRVVVPTHYDNFFRPLGQRMEFVTNVEALHAARGDRLGRRRHRAGRPSPLRHASRSAWRRSGRSCPWSASSSGRGWRRSHSGRARNPRSRRLAASRARDRWIARRSSSVVNPSTSFFARGSGLRAQERHLELAGGPGHLRASNGSRAAIARTSLHHCAGRPAPRSRARRPTPLRAERRSWPGVALRRFEDHVAAGAKGRDAGEAQRPERRPQLLVLDPATADVHPAQKGDVAIHRCTLRGPLEDGGGRNRTGVRGRSAKVSTGLAGA